MTTESADYVRDYAFRHQADFTAEQYAELVGSANAFDKASAAKDAHPKICAIDPCVFSVFIQSWNTMRYNFLLITGHYLNDTPA